MHLHSEITGSAFRNLYKQKKIRLAGNLKLKIYGTLKCASGKRMKRENRCFFISAEEATIKGFRPCGHCMREAYKKFKHESIPT